MFKLVGLKTKVERHVSVGSFKCPQHYRLRGEGVGVGLNSFCAGI